MKCIFNIYDKHIRGIGYIIDIIYQIAFGLWSFSIKEYSGRQVFKDLFAKFIIIFISAFAFALTTLEVKFSGLEAFFNTICIIILYLISNRKSMWPDKVKSSSKDYLKRTIGDIPSRIPEIIMFLCIVIPGLINAPTWGLVVGLGLGCLANILFVQSVLNKVTSPK